MTAQPNPSTAVVHAGPPSSTLQVCVTGGDLVPWSIPYSNMTMAFGGPAITHFGTQAH